MSHTLSPARLEAFSDGVIAVIITIMVLELKVPTAADCPTADGPAALGCVLPVLILYFLSFVQVGIYWVNHHYLIDEAKTIGHGLLWANLIFLFCLSLIPFATLWVGAKSLSPFSVSLYATTCVLPAISFTVLSRAVRAHSDTMPHASQGKQLFSLGLYLAAIGVALYWPYIALVLIGIVAVIWVLPPRHPENDVHQHTHPQRPTE